MFQQLTAPCSLIITCKLEEEELRVPISPVHDAHKKLNRDISRGGHTFFLDVFFLEILSMVIAVFIFILFKCTLSARFDFIDCQCLILRLTRGFKVKKRIKWWALNYEMQTIDDYVIYTLSDF